MEKEASSFLKKQLYGKSVTLVYDYGPKQDKYGRESAYVFFEGIHINELMVKSGYGTVAYISKPNTLLFPQMLEIEKEVRHQRLVCGTLKDMWMKRNIIIIVMMRLSTQSIAI